MIRKYQNHTPQTNQRHPEEEPQNADCHNTSGRQLTQSNQLYYQDDCKTRWTQSTEKQTIDQTQNPHKQWEQQNAFFLWSV